MAQWNGSAGPTVFVDVLQLIVTIPANDLAAGGTAVPLRLTIGGVASNTMTIAVQ